MNRDEFVKAWKGASLDDLRKAGEQQGATFKATTHKEMVEEAWQFYQEQQHAKRMPAPAEQAPTAAPNMPHPVNVQPVPVQPPAPVLPGEGADVGQAPPGVTTGLGSDKLKHEGRVIGPLTQRARAGYVFGREWIALDPEPTSEQLETIRADGRIQLRIKG